MEILNEIMQSVSDIAPQIMDILGQLFARFFGILKYAFHWVTSNPATFGGIYTQVIRFVMPLLALHILVSVLREMLSVRNPSETWGYLVSPDMGRFAIRHWECTIGRAGHCDITISFATVSKTQCALIRDDDGIWYIHNLSDKLTTTLNGDIVNGKKTVRHGDTIGIGGVEFTFEAITLQEHEIQKKKRIIKSSPLPPWTSFITLSIFQLLTALEFIITRPENIKDVLTGYGILFVVMWAYVLFTKALGQTGFEPEILAFFACTLNLAVTATSSPSIMLKQSLCICIGVFGFVFLGWYLRDLERTVKTRYIMAAGAILLFTINIVFGKVLWGAKNWISIFGISVQPSELAKVCFIFAGAATLDRLFVKKNLFGFMCLSGFCLMALAIMGDFGTAAIFFVVFLVIAFLRSGDFATLALICGATVGAIALVLRFKPYIASRFAVWGHVWEDASGMGYQQVRTMSAAASGGLIGVGPGNGWLHNVAAANTDLVFGVLCEEWGLIIALLSVSIIVSLSIFTFRVTRNGRSSYYTIAASAATSLFVFQTILNVFGSVDILPLTGVTFPFISCGGTSMITCWCLLAFVKASDTRQNASFAVKKKIALGDVPDDPLAAFMSIKKPEIDNEIPDLPSEPETQQEQIQLTPEEEMDAFFRQFEEIEALDFDDGFGRIHSDFNLYDEFSESDISTGFDLFEDEVLGKAAIDEDSLLGRPPRKKRYPYSDSEKSSRKRGDR